MAQPTIDPRVLQALAAGQDIGQYGYMTSQYQPGQWEGGDGGSFVNSGPAQTHLIQGIDNSSANVFDDKGNFLGLNSGASDSRALFNFIATAAAMYGGANALAGMGGGAGGGLPAGGSGLPAGGSTAGSAGAYTTAAADSQAANAALGLGANSGSVPASVNLVNAGGTMATGANSLLGLDYSTWAKLAGAALGAASSGDQEQTSTQNREPWGPSQDFLKQLISQGQGLNQQYQQQPFSATQQQAYGNQFGLLNSANQNMPAWMQGMQANASGANNYDRRNPQRSLLGAGQTTTPQFGLLNPSFKFGG